jgi:flavin reductase (DIM6/NTAB) family NADH-FMN oxidoreductase RutF/ADP-ribose pyrophosphatase YjhB (NUDIX family)
MTAIDPRALRDAFGAFLTGVTVVTTHNPAGEPIGFTANSFASVSLDPPLLLVCIARSSRNYEAVTSAKGFAINILAESQKDVSNTFARPVEDRFAAVKWNLGPHGSPVFADVAAWFDCATESIVEAGDHAILIGKVEAFENGKANGLGYARGGYFFPALADKAISAASDGGLVIGAVAERDGQVLLVDAGNEAWKLPECTMNGGDGVEALQAYIEELTGLEANIGLLYSVYENTTTRRQHVIYRAMLGEGELKAGTFHAVDALPATPSSDNATAEILKRYSAESSVGNFGVYFGNELSGRVHALARKA